MKSPKTPESPDLVAVAKEQGLQNIKAAQVGAALNNTNLSTPWGKVTYTRNASSRSALPATPTRTTAQSYTLPTGQTINIGGLTGYGGGLASALAGGSPDPMDEQWTQTLELSPEQQALYGTSTQNQQAIGNLAGQAAGRAAAAPEVDYNAAPQRVYSVAGSDYSGLRALPSGSPQERQQVQDALYGSAKRYLDPQFSDADRNLRTNLLNSGIREGSEAWNNEMGRVNRDRTFAYGDARDRAIMAGGAEESRILADALAGRQQGMREQDTLYGQRMGNADLTNLGRDANLTEQTMRRQIPLNELMALYQPYQSPLMPNGAGGIQGPQAPDIMGGTLANYQNAIDLYNAKAAKSGNTFNSLLGAAGTAAAIFSDRRLKTDIRPTGESINGFPLYRFRYLWDADTEHVGVMADEVERVMPDAVHEIDGFKAVDYAAIGAGHLVH